MAEQEKVDWEDYKVYQRVKKILEAPDPDEEKEQKKEPELCTEEEAEKILSSWGLGAPSKKDTRTEGERLADRLLDRINF